MPVEKDLIEVAMRAAGEVGARGWGYVVEWTVINAYLSLAGYIALLVFFGWALKRLMAWHPKADPGELTPFGAARIAGMAVLILLCMPCTFASVVNSLRDALAPEGAAIMNAMGRH